MSKLKKKVMVGMSGGVDSSVAAALLLEKGYDVIGVTLQIWPDIKDECRRNETGCCSLSAVEDARKVADKLNIPYYVLNFKDIFRNCVIDYFIEEYKKGRTPNPCIACNRRVKFEAMLQKAVSMGMDYIATGHYAKVVYDESGRRFLLKKSATATKDQTYALYTLTQYQLSKLLLPVGEYTKEQIREIAANLGLPVAKKPDSQEICFVDDNDYSRFITENSDYKPVPGYFRDTSGNILGKHTGIINYTVGQRKGLGIALGKPMYVVSIDPETNTVYLGDETEVYSKGLIASDINLISIDSLNGTMEVNAKIRYTAREAKAFISPMDDGSVKVEFETPQRAVTPGQSVVFYNGDIVVGGGIIEKAL